MQIPYHLHPALSYSLQNLASRPKKSVSVLLICVFVQDVCEFVDVQPYFQVLTDGQLIHGWFVQFFFVFFFMLLLFSEFPVDIFGA